MENTNQTTIKPADGSRSNKAGDGWDHKTWVTVEENHIIRKIIVTFYTEWGDDSNELVLSVDEAYALRAAIGQHASQVDRRSR